MFHVCKILGYSQMWRDKFVCGILTPFPPNTHALIQFSAFFSKIKYFHSSYTYLNKLISLSEAFFKFIHLML